MTTAAELRTLESLEARLSEAERKLFETEAKYSNLLEQLPAAIYIDSPEPNGPTRYVPGSTSCSASRPPSTSLVPVTGTR